MDNIEDILRALTEDSPDDGGDSEDSEYSGQSGEDCLTG